MKLLQKSKDGGPQSPVDGYFLIEVKCLGSIALLKFNRGCRESYHTHAFNALTWFICGDMEEQDKGGGVLRYRRSLLPKVTPRNKNHRVLAHRTSWCITLRGPWHNSWTEYDPCRKETLVLSHGRKLRDVIPD